MVIKIQSWIFLLTFVTKNKSGEWCFSQSSLVYRDKWRHAIVVRIWLLITSSQITHAALHKVGCSSVGSWVYTESQLPPGAAASLTLVHWTLLCLTDIGHLPPGVWIDYHVQWAPPAAAPKRSHLRCSEVKWKSPPHSYFVFIVVPKQGWLCPQSSLWKLDFLLRSIFLSPYCSDTRKRGQIWEETTCCPLHSILLAPPLLMMLNSLKQHNPVEVECERCSLKFLFLNCSIFPKNVKRKRWN